MRVYTPDDDDDDDDGDYSGGDDGGDDGGGDEDAPTYEEILAERTDEFNGSAGFVPLTLSSRQSTDSYFETYKGPKAPTGRDQAVFFVHGLMGGYGTFDNMIDDYVKEKLGYSVQIEVGVNGGQLVAPEVT